jgi:hypothetical protein
MTMPIEPGENGPYRDAYSKNAGRRGKGPRRKKPKRFLPDLVDDMERRMMLSTFTVTSAADSGPGTLRDMIDQSNDGSGPNVIDFDIASSGIQTIDLAMGLPALSVPVTIDGTTEPGYATGAPTVVLDGMTAGTTSGLFLGYGSDGSTILGLGIENFQSTGQAGIYIEYGGDTVAACTLDSNADGVIVAGTNDTIGGTAVGAGNLIFGNAYAGVSIGNSSLSGTATYGNVVVGNLIGTDPTGTIAEPNNTGVLIDASPDNTIGGTVTGAGNLISGNYLAGLMIEGPSTTGIVVAGNLIGTDLAGTGAIANGGAGVVIGAGANDNTIGGLTSTPGTGAGNLISGNTNGYGVDIDGSGTTGNVVAGDLIGTDITGDVALGDVTGVFIYNGASGNTIGGPSGGYANVISGNSAIGVNISGSPDNVVAGNLIGTDPAGTIAIGNGSGVLVNQGATDNTVGGTVSGDTNIISGNAYYGVEVYGGATSGTIIAGNKIGTDITGNVALPNGHVGVDITSGATDNTIGGLTATPGTGAGNLISGNRTNGVEISSTGTSANSIVGNLIGTDITGTLALPNENGVVIENASGNSVGGSVSGDANIISGNSRGIYLNGSTGTVIVGNKIGTDITGKVALPNYWGIAISNDASGNTVGGTISGDSNLISGNRGYGIYLFAGANDSIIVGNQIGTDITGTVAIANNIGLVIVSSPDNTIGGSVTGDSNLISGNTKYGIFLYGTGTTGTIISGNKIGTDITGTLALHNGSGVFVENAPSNTIGGSVSNDSNLISGNLAYGIFVLGNTASGTIIFGNQIGTDITGTLALPNDFGVLINNAPDTMIGGSVSGDSNLISGNLGYGVYLGGSGASGTIVAGNKIGTDITGTLALANGEGIKALNTSDITIGGTVAGAGNMIAFNTGDAVNIVTGTGNAILEDLIFTNGSGIVLTSGGNDDQAAPVITNVMSGATGPSASQTTISVDLTGAGFTAGSMYLVEFFASEPSLSSSGVEAQIYLGSEIFSGGTTGNFTNSSLPAPLFSDQVVTATATLLQGTTPTNTSTFAPAFTVAGSFDFLVTTTAATGNGSLEQAILNANADTGNPNADTIGFLITTGSAPYVITPQAAGLDTISRPVYIYANSQPGYDGTPIIVLDGTGVNGYGLGLGPGSSGSFITGFDIINFTGGNPYGIDLNSNDNIIQSNYIGVETDGKTGALTNTGILITGSGNTIGGSTAGAGNLISKTDQGITMDGTLASDNVIVGNKIGTDSTGTMVIGGDQGIVVFNVYGTTIGGTASGDMNLISGNYAGIYVYGSVNGPDSTIGNTIVGNLIGTDITGTLALGNTYGVQIEKAPYTMIGGSVSGDANVISGNVFGISVNDPETTGTLIAGNKIGTDITGTRAVPNSTGIEFLNSPNTTIGGSVAGDMNLISGNTDDGIYLQGSGTTGTLIIGNQIGTDITGTIALANRTGISVRSAPSNTIGGSASGDMNLISGNTSGAIYIYGSTTTDTLVIGNRIGTDISGTLRLGDGGAAVDLQGGTSDNTIGGVTSTPGTGAGNLISSNSFGVAIYDNSSDNVVAGNLIGTDITGTISLGNVGGVLISDAQENTIGGSVLGAANEISGNLSSGIELEGSTATNNVIVGNLIGTDITGTLAVPNNSGVVVDDAPDNTIGGTVSGDTNVISGNSNQGIYLYGSGTTGTIIAGNKIGTDITGTLAVPNNWSCPRRVEQRGM